MTKYDRAFLLFSLSYFSYLDLLRIFFISSRIFDTAFLCAKIAAKSTMLPHTKHQRLMQKSVFRDSPPDTRLGMEGLIRAQHTRPPCLIGENNPTAISCGQPSYVMAPDSHKKTQLNCSAKNAFLGSPASQHTNHLAY